MWFFIVAAALSIAAAAKQAQAQRAGGKAAYAAGLYKQTLAGRRAEAMEMQAGQERAASQRVAIEQRRQADYVASAARARAAAGGGSVSDPTVTNILANIEKEGELRALTAMYQGEEAAKGLEYGAELTRAGGAGEAWAGLVEKRLSREAATSSLLQGGASAFSTIGAGRSSPSLFQKYADGTGIYWNTPRYGYG